MIKIEKFSDSICRVSIGNEHRLITNCDVSKIENTLYDRFGEKYTNIEMLQFGLERLKQPKSVKIMVKNAEIKTAFGAYYKSIYVDYGDGYAKLKDCYSEKFAIKEVANLKKQIVADGDKVTAVVYKYGTSV